MNIERALATPGWMDQIELEYIATLAATHTAIAEVGSWRGRSANAWADNTAGLVYCIDTWADNAYGAVFPGDSPVLCQHPDWLWEEFKRNTAECRNIVPFRMSSVAGAHTMLSAGVTFDVIFIDAGHNYEDVIADISAWRPLLRDGGVLCGHDYMADHPAVIRAVDEMIPKFMVVGTIWTTQL